MIVWVFLAAFCSHLGIMFVRMQGLSPHEIDNKVALFKEVQKVIDSKQLKPMVRTQYMRTLFQVWTCLCYTYTDRH